MSFHEISIRLIPIPTIDEFKLFIGRGAVRLPPPHAGVSCIRRCGVRGISQLNQLKVRHLKTDSTENGMFSYPLANIGVSGRLHDV